MGREGDPRPELRARRFASWLLLGRRESRGEKGVCEIEMNETYLSVELFEGREREGEERDQKEEEGNESSRVEKRSLRRTLMYQVG